MSSSTPAQTALEAVDRDAAHRSESDSRSRVASYRSRIWGRDHFIRVTILSFVEHWLRELVRPGGACVDVGCGNQPFRELIESLGGRYVGVDVTQNATGTVDHLCSLTELSLPDASADVILCTEVLEHVSDTFAAFGQMARVLKPGGRIIVTTPFAYRLHEEPYDFVRLTPFQMVEAARRAGLAVERENRGGNDAMLVASAFDQMLLDSNFCGSWKGGVLIRAGLRTSANLLAAAVTRLFADKLPRRQYLNTQAVLCKPEEQQKLPSMS